MNSYSFSSRSIEPPPTSKNNNQQLDRYTKKKPNKSKNRYDILLMLVITVFLVGIYLCIAGLFLYRSYIDYLDSSHKSNLTIYDEHYLNVYDARIDLEIEKRGDFWIKNDRS